MNVAGWSVIGWVSLAIIGWLLLGWACLPALMRRIYQYDLQQLWHQEREGERGQAPGKSPTQIP